MKLTAIKRIAACVSAAALLTTFSAATASASAVKGDYARVSASDVQNYMNTRSSKELKLIREKEKQSSKASASAVTKGAATKISIPGVFWMYQQETDTYCVPACIQSAVRYLSGTILSQADINSYINMDFSKIPAYVNGKENQCYYILVNAPNQTSLCNKIYYDIVTEQAPAFLRIANTSSATWYYLTYGHCVLSNAIYDDLSIIQLADPLGGRVSGCPYYYLKSASLVSAYTTHMCY